MYQTRSLFLECDCDERGIYQSIAFKCNKDTGKCICKGDIVGERCDRCKTGTIDFPECRRQCTYGYFPNFRTIPYENNHF